MGRLTIRKRNPRRKRSQYYMTDLPREVVRQLKQLREDFLRTFNRDYEDLDPQFWDTSRKDKPVPQPGLDEFIEQLANAMAKSHHHPAHIWAVMKTQRILYDGNFKDVPDAWTVEWEEAIKSYEKWSDHGDRPIIETPHGGW